MQHLNDKPRGFTLGELIAVLVILSITAALLFPFFTGYGPSKARLQRNQCMSNLKKIGLAALTYAQDYDATLPPVASKEEPHKYVQIGNKYYPAEQNESHDNVLLSFTRHYWLGMSSRFYWRHYPESGGRDYYAEAKGYLQPYCHGKDFLLCPVVTLEDKKTAYMVNDLAGGAHLNSIVRPAVTVLMMDGETNFVFAGHAYEPTGQINKPTAFTKPEEDSGAVKGAATHHSGGANYLLADGHVKWFKPEAVFFPPRENMSQSHYDQARNEITGPNPGGTMDLTNVPFQATFHLR